MYEVTWIGNAIADGDHYQFVPCLRVTSDGVAVGSAWIYLRKQAAMNFTALLGGDDAETRLQQALVVYAVQRLERVLQVEPELLRSGPEWVLDDDNIDELLVLERKHCDYALRDGRDLLCTAAGSNDETVVGTLGRRRVAPTSASICSNCDLPDSRISCSHLIHPEVVAIRAMGGLHARDKWRQPCAISATISWATRCGAA